MDQLTITTYDNNAERYAEKLVGIGSRKEAIDTTFQFCTKQDPVVFDGLGERLFYLHTLEDIMPLVSGYEVVLSERKTVGNNT